MTPIILFVYARLDHLERVLECLKQNHVPLLYVFSDGYKGEQDRERVLNVRRRIREIDWCEVKLEEREQNLGLGRNILSGVTEVSQLHDRWIVWEDDLICAEGTYRWICAALAAYENDATVMSVTGWTHRKVIPVSSSGLPYFDGRAECWVWGTWRRAWTGMQEQSAMEKLKLAEKIGLPRDAYGEDLPCMAAEEQKKNIWAVRWLYHHLMHGGICLRPPWSLVEHVGLDASATNSAGDSDWANTDLQPAPLPDNAWPEVRENPECKTLWASARRQPSFFSRAWGKLSRQIRV